MANVVETSGVEKKAEFFRIDGEQVRQHADGLIRSRVEEKLNAMLDAEADELCRGKRYGRNPDRENTRSGSCHRTLQTRVGEVELTVPRLRNLPCEIQVIDRQCAQLDGHYLRNRFDSWINDELRFRVWR